MWAALLCFTVLTNAAVYEVVCAPPSLADPTSPWLVVLFFPSTLEIAVGDAISFTSPTETCTMAFASEDMLPNLHPFEESPFGLRVLPIMFPNGTTTVRPGEVVSSGLMGVGGINPAPNWIFDFPEEGTYHFTDPLHPWVVGTVKVVPAPQLSPAEVKAAATADAQAQLGLAIALSESEGLFEPDAYKIGKLGDGDNYLVLAAYATLAVGPFAAWHQFVPANPTVYVGDSLTFVTGSFIPHSVAFNSSGQFDFAPRIIDGAAYFKPEYFFPWGNLSDYSGGFRGLGFFIHPIGGGPPFGVYQNTITFTGEGSFPYVCGIHMPLAMGGVVTVLPRPPPAENPPPPAQPQPQPQTIQPPSSAASALQSVLFLYLLVCGLLF